MPDRQQPVLSPTTAPTSNAAKAVAAAGAAALKLVIIRAMVARSITTEAGATGAAVNAVAAMATAVAVAAMTAAAGSNLLHKQKLSPDPCGVVKAGPKNDATMIDAERAEASVAGTAATTAMIAKMTAGVAATTTTTAMSAAGAVGESVPTGAMIAAGKAVMVVTTAADHRWDNSWRNDRRYDWRGHRSRYRDHYRHGRYYAPHHRHRYSRFSIGFYIGNAFYHDRYWLNDPWSYRLPEAYGPYRWVRYYDDVLLIDIRNGYVVDVIHDFFW
jgi:Ni/Co efflux regulator RcnB